MISRAPISRLRRDLSNPRTRAKPDAHERRNNAGVPGLSIEAEAAGNCYGNDCGNYGTGAAVLGPNGFRLLT